MLILVSVSISLVINSGLIGVARNAGEQTKSAYDNEAHYGEKITIGENEYNSLDEYMAVLNQNDEDISSEIETILFSVGDSYSDSGFYFYNTDSATFNANKTSTENEDDCCIYAAWANGYAFIRTLDKLDFTDIDKIEVGASFGANTTSGQLTFSVGVTSSTENNISFEDDLKTSVVVQNSYASSTDSMRSVDRIIEFDTSEISGEYYLKILSEHGPTPSAYTTGARVYWIKLYYRIPTFTVTTEELLNGSHQITISNINCKYISNNNNWQVKYKKVDEENWQTSNSLSFTVNSKGFYNIKIVNNNLESNVQTIYSGGTYIKLDYIEITGKQYIDTGYKANQDTKIEMSLRSINWNNIFMPFGGRGGNPNYCVGLWMYYNNATNNTGNYLRYGSNDNQIGLTLVNDYRNTEFDIAFENGKITIGEEEIEFPEVDDFTCKYNLYLGALNDSQNILNIGRSARIYSCKISEGNTIIRDYIPVYNTLIRQAGLYDQEHDIFYGSLGTEDFAPGFSAETTSQIWDVLYTDLEYLQFASGNYIDTRIIPSNHTTEIKFNFDSYNNDEHLFGTNASSANNYYHFTSYSNKYYWGRNGSEANNGSWTTGIHTLVFNGENNSVVLDDTSLGSGTNILSTGNLFLGKRESDANLTAKIYYVKITDKSTGNLVRDLIPVYNKLTQNTGFYDRVTSDFLTNSGTGVIAPGPEI